MKKYIALLLVILFAVLAYFAFSEGSESNPFSSAAAVIALAISLFNFYTQYLHKDHRIYCTMVSVGYDGKKLRAHYTFDNVGTYQEAILGVTFVFPENDSGTQYSTVTRQHHGDHMPELLDPIVVNPGDIVVKKFEWEFGFDELLLHLKTSNGCNQNNNKTEYDISIKVDFIDPETRGKASKLLHCTKIRIYDKDAHISEMLGKRESLFAGKTSKI